MPGVTTHLGYSTGVSLSVTGEDDELDYVWDASKGSITNNGNSGSVNMSMVPQSAMASAGSATLSGPGDVHIQGSWHC